MNPEVLIFCALFVFYLARSTVGAAELREIEAEIRKAEAVLLRLTAKIAEDQTRLPPHQCYYQTPAENLREHPGPCGDRGECWEMCSWGNPPVEPPSLEACSKPTTLPRAIVLRRKDP